MITLAEPSADTSVWIECTHELPPSHEPVMTKIHVAGFNPNSIRPLRFCDLSRDWYNERSFALPAVLHPTHWRYLSDLEKWNLRHNVEPLTAMESAT